MQGEAAAEDRLCGLEVAAPLVEAGVDLIVEAAVATLDGDHGFAWSEAVALSGGRVAAVGERRRVREIAGPRTRIVRLGAEDAILPGFSDSHLHLGLAALAADRLDLLEVGTLDAALRALRGWAAGHPSGWLEGFGWTPARFGRWPTADDLETAAPGRLVALWSHDHHALLLSRAALAALGVDAESTDPAGGIVRRDEAGAPTGVLQERAIELVAGRLPGDSPDRLDEAIERYVASLCASGIVAVQDPGPLVADPDLRLDMATCLRLEAAGRLPIRVHVSVREDSLATAIRRGLRTGAPVTMDEIASLTAIPDRERRCRVGWLKLFADGALGSRTAALLEPYEPLPGEATDWRGVATAERGALADLAARAAAAGIATQIHAIGDAAVRTALDVLSTTRGEFGPEPSQRHGRGPRPWHRLEHVQLATASDAGRFAAAGIGASVQPIHIRSDARPARVAWGSRADERSYPYRWLRDAGAVLAFGSDAPVEVADPWAALSYAVLRGAGHGEEPPLGPAQAIDIATAVRASCLGPAVLAGENDRGRLMPGLRADFVVVPRAPFERGGERQLGGVEPRSVVVDGIVRAGEPV